MPAIINTTALVEPVQAKFQSFMSFFRPLASYYRRHILLSISHGQPAPTLRICSFNTRNLHTKIQINNFKPSPFPQSSFYSWAKWLLGSVLATALPFWNKSWKRLLRIEDEVEIVVDAVETAAEIVEKVANVAEKVSLDIAEEMTEDGKLKEAVLFVENVAKEVAVEAHRTQEIIHKMEELKDEIDELKDNAGKEKHVDKEEDPNKLNK
ncbi:uncharacterized protein LOC110097074 [Dendrobium catenatum]|uniref:Uncharacterized protein n=1 Tax=Dendrobium catenatum TaxID=906689 RepID=A0A2I0VWE1_9ASPA|nr:uncharacterized protein LOC110097074 [Dendrobium catenatum]PKU67709.1 hypothetical protein MA16_Dca013739 [Dendrobium catenatum]